MGVTPLAPQASARVLRWSLAQAVARYAPERPGSRGSSAARATVLGAPRGAPDTAVRAKNGKAFQVPETLRVRRYDIRVIAPHLLRRHFFRGPRSFCAPLIEPAFTPARALIRSRSTSRPSFTIHRRSVRCCTPSASAACTTLPCCSMSSTRIAARASTGVWMTNEPINVTRGICRQSARAVPKILVPNELPVVASGTVPDRSETATRSSLLWLLCHRHTTCNGG